MDPSAKNAGGRRVTRWTRELIIEKIKEWDARYGEPPCSADWNPSLARWRAQEWRAERYREGVWPSTNAAKRAFDGSFDAAVRAAGLEPHKPGPRRGEAPAARAVAAPAPAPVVVPELESAAPIVAGSSALDRRRRAAERRVERAERAAEEARRRARRANERELRARRGRERAEASERVACELAERRLEALAADADARVRAAADQADAAVRDA